MRNQCRRGKNVRSSQYLKRRPSPWSILFAAFRLLTRTRSTGNQRHLASRSVTNIALDPWPRMIRTGEKFVTRTPSNFGERADETAGFAIARGDRNGAAGEVNAC